MTRRPTPEARAPRRRPLNELIRLVQDAAAKGRPVRVTEAADGALTVEPLDPAALPASRGGDDVADEIERARRAVAAGRA